MKSLVFDEETFIERNQSEEIQQLKRKLFVDSILWFLAKHPRETQLWKFSLAMSRLQEDDAPVIATSINYAVSLGVEHLELDFSKWIRIGDRLLRLPERVYQYHANLDSLKLYCCEIDFSRLTSMQFLRNLSLGYTIITSDQLGSLVNSCPILDSLRLEECWGMGSLNITVPDLKYSNLNNFVMKGCDNNGVLELEGHALRYFEYSGQVVKFQMGNQFQLVELRFDFSMQRQFVRSSKDLCFLMGDLLTVKFLTVCSVFLQIISGAYLDPDSEFDFDANVQHLTMNTQLHVNEFIGIKFMFAACPKMNTLTLCIAPGTIFDDYEAPFIIDHASFWTGTPQAETCLMRSLRVLNVRGFLGAPNQMSLIRYIMRFGRCLRSVNVCLPQVQEGNFLYSAIVSQASLLMQSPKANPDLEISVVQKVL